MVRPVSVLFAQIDNFLQSRNFELTIIFSGTRTDFRNALFSSGVLISASVKSANHPLSKRHQ